MEVYKYCISSTRESYIRMGLREKVALLLIAFTFQIACTDRTPQSPNQNPFERYMGKKNSRNNVYSNSKLLSSGLPNNAQERVVMSQNIQAFPQNNVTPRTSFDKAYCSNQRTFGVPQTSPSQMFSSKLLDSYKKDARNRRKMQKLAFNTKTEKIESKNAQPVYMLDKGSFPEVDYPLSAIDSWAPKYWNGVPNTPYNIGEPVIIRGEVSNQPAIQINTNNLAKSSKVKKKHFLETVGGKSSKIIAPEKNKTTKDGLPHTPHKLKKRIKTTTPHKNLNVNGKLQTKKTESSNLNKSKVLRKAKNNSDRTISLIENKISQHDIEKLEKKSNLILRDFIQGDLLQLAQSNSTDLNIVSEQVLNPKPTNYTIKICFPSDNLTGNNELFNKFTEMSSLSKYFRSTGNSNLLEKSDQHLSQSDLIILHNLVEKLLSDISTRNSYHNDSIHSMGCNESHIITSTDVTLLDTSRSCGGYTTIDNHYICPVPKSDQCSSENTTVSLMEILNGSTSIKNSGSSIQQNNDCNMFDITSIEMLNDKNNTIIEQHNKNKLVEETKNERITETPLDSNELKNVHRYKTPLSDPFDGVLEVDDQNKTCSEFNSDYGEEKNTLLTSSAYDFKNKSRIETFSDQLSNDNTKNKSKNTNSLQILNSVPNNVNFDKNHSEEIIPNIINSAIDDSMVENEQKMLKKQELSNKNIFPEITRNDSNSKMLSENHLLDTIPVNGIPWDNHARDGVKNETVDGKYTNTSTLKIDNETFTPVDKPTTNTIKRVSEYNILSKTSPNTNNNAKVNTVTDTPHTDDVASELGDNSFLEILETNMMNVDLKGETITAKSLSRSDDKADISKITQIDLLFNHSREDVSKYNILSQANESIVRNDNVKYHAGADNDFNSEHETNTFSDINKNKIINETFENSVLADDIKNIMNNNITNKSENEILTNKTYLNTIKNNCEINIPEKQIPNTPLDLLENHLEQDLDNLTLQNLQKEKSENVSEKLSNNALPSAVDSAPGIIKLSDTIGFFSKNNLEKNATSNIPIISNDDSENYGGNHNITSDKPSIEDKTLADLLNNLENNNIMLTDSLSDNKLPVKNMEDKTHSPTNIKLADKEEAFKHDIISDSDAEILPGKSEMGKKFAEIKMPKYELLSSVDNDETQDNSDTDGISPNVPVKNIILYVHSDEIDFPETGTEPKLIYDTGNSAIFDEEIESDERESFEMEPGINIPIPNLLNIKEINLLDMLIENINSKILTKLKEILTI